MKGGDGRTFGHTRRLALRRPGPRSPPARVPARTLKAAPRLGRRHASNVRTFRWAWIIGTGVLVLLGMAVYAGLLGDPPIAPMKGEVVSVEPIDGRIEICLADPIDAGSTYGNRVGGEPECWSGILADPKPQAGECVIIESRGESAVIGVESAHGVWLTGGRRHPACHWRATWAGAPGRLVGDVGHSTRLDLHRATSSARPADR